MVAGVGSLGVLLVGGAAGYRRLAPSGGDSEPDSGSGDGDGERSEPPFDVATIEAPGSEEGSITVPEADWVTVLNFARTACPTSAGQLDVLADARDAVDDERVRFLTVVTPVGDPADDEDDFAEWWADHDGDWSLGVDDDRSIYGYYEVTVRPTTIVLDGDGEVHWRATGNVTSDAVVGGIEDALDAVDGDG